MDMDTEEDKKVYPPIHFQNCHSLVRAQSVRTPGSTFGWSQGKNKWRLTWLFRVVILEEPNSVLVFRNDYDTPQCFWLPPHQVQPSMYVWAQGNEGWKVYNGSTDAYLQSITYAFEHEPELPPLAVVYKNHVLRGSYDQEKDEYDEIDNSKKAMSVALIATKTFYRKSSAYPELWWYTPTT